MSEDRVLTRNEATPRCKCDAQCSALVVTGPTLPCCQRSLDRAQAGNGITIFKKSKPTHIQRHRGAFVRSSAYWASGKSQCSVQETRILILRKKRCDCLWCDGRDERQLAERAIALLEVPCLGQLHCFPNCCLPRHLAHWDLIEKSLESKCYFSLYPIEIWNKFNYLSPTHC